MNSNAGPEHAITLVHKGQGYTRVTMKQKSILGIVHYWKTTSKERVETGPTMHESLKGINSNEIDVVWGNYNEKLHLYGSREEVVKALSDAGSCPQLKISNPPGIFIAVHANKKDEVIVRVASSAGSGGSEFANQSDGWWHFHDVTHYLRLNGKGRYSVHPQDLVLPLENIFKENKVSPIITSKKK
jgi:hypothetical protein